ncbi:MAG: hypothetical protein AAGK04_04990 [Planctomycetota bacterium]
MRAELRRWRVGVLQADEQLESVHFVAAPTDGRLLLPVSRDAAEAHELVLWIPEESFDAMQGLLEPRVIGEDDWTPALEGARDRYLAYHGRADTVYWMLCGADSFKWRDEVIPGVDILTPNAIGSVEGGLLKRLNASGHVAALARRFAGATVSEPVAVGVDELGIDIRSRVGVLRVRFDQPTTEADAGALIDAMLGEVADG